MTSLICAVLAAAYVQPIQASHLPIYDVQPLRYSNTQLNVFYKITNPAAWTAWNTGEPKYWVLDADNFSLDGNWRDVTPATIPAYTSQPVRISLGQEMTRGWIAIVISGTRPNGETQWSLSAARFPYEAKSTTITGPGTTVPITLHENLLVSNAKVISEVKDSTEFYASAGVGKCKYHQNASPNFPGSGWTDLHLNGEKTRDTKFVDFSVEPSLSGYYAVTAKETYWITYDVSVKFKWKQVSAYMRRIP